MTVQKATATLTPMKVHKLDGNYIVIAAQLNDGEVEWVQVSKPYAHSTSAFAALGRLYQKELLGK